MTKERFRELLRVSGPIAPEGLEEYIGDLGADETELLPGQALAAVLEENRVPAEKQAPLFAALAAVNRVPELVELAHVMAADAVRALHRCTAAEFEAPFPACLEGFDRDAFAFLFSQLCVLKGRAALRARGVPEAYDRDIPERMTRKQLRKYTETGDIRFRDYPWDMNFFCCAIFLLDRFYFLPYRWEEPATVWRNRETGKVRAIWPGGVKVRRDGQLDGVNGVFDPEAFETVYEETEERIRANPVLPEGRIAPGAVTLEKRCWEKVVGDGDYLLGLHIPGGEGYMPERVRSSCEQALAFFDRYYPEYTYKGFWSESWLFDPGLAELLGPERNIVRVQRQFYRFPTMEGDNMTRLEVLGSSKADYRKMTPRSSLERGLFAAWDRGERFHCTGMFLLREETPAIGTEPYCEK